MATTSSGTAGGGGVRSHDWADSQSRNGCLSKAGGVSPECTCSAGQMREESGVSTSSHTTSSLSTKPNSNLVSASTSPTFASLAAASAKRSRQSVWALARASSPTMLAAVDKSMLRSCPVDALVDGVNIGVGKGSVSCNPAGAAIWCTVPLLTYSLYA